MTLEKEILPPVLPGSNQRPSDHESGALPLSYPRPVSTVWNERAKERTILTCPQAPLGVALAVVKAVSGVCLHFLNRAHHTSVPLQQRKPPSQPYDVPPGPPWDDQAYGVLCNTVSHRSVACSSAGVPALRRTFTPHGCSTGLKSGALAAHWLSYF